MGTVKNSIDHKKWRSRTWWLTIAWVSFIPLSIVAQMLIASYNIEIPISTIATGAVTATSLFLGGEKIAKVFREKNESNA